jgi:hypothetical protein
MWWAIVLTVALAPAARAQAPVDSLPSRSVPADSVALTDTLDFTVPAPDTSRVIRPGPLDPLTHRDTTRVHSTLGFRVDATNESYYEEAFIDTTFLERQLVETPETRYAGVWSGSWDGTRRNRSAQYHLQTNVTLGDRLEREFVLLHWRDVGSHWTWSLDPSAEHRRDRTFGRDLAEWRAAMSARARRTLADDFTAAEFGTRAELYRSSGVGSEFQPDRNGRSLFAALDHMGLEGDEWRIGYSATARVFPDSVERDHVEHFAEARWRTRGGGSWLALEGNLTRRVTLHLVPTSRDNFWLTTALVDTRLASLGPWSVQARAEGEATRYDLPDSTLYFDYQVARAATMVRWEPDIRWAFELGPRIEGLRAPFDPAEEYGELSGALELESLVRGSWWSLTPAVGWREYRKEAGFSELFLHSDYAFYALDVIADQGLVAGVRFKAIGSFRWERHVDPAQSARSIYASLELVRSLH